MNYEDEERMRNEIVMRNIPYLKHPHMPGNEKQHDFLLNMTEMSRGIRDTILKAIDNYIV